MSLRENEAAPSRFQSCVRRTLPPHNRQQTTGRSRLASRLSTTAIGCRPVATQRACISSPAMVSIGPATIVAAVKAPRCKSCIIGASVVRRDAAINRTEDLDVEVCEATNSCIIRSAFISRKPFASGRWQFKE
jgi:hypothetical protein